MKSLVATLLWVTLLLGCGGNSSTGGGPTPNAQLNGSWHATLTPNTSGVGSTLDVFIFQHGATLSSDRVHLGTTLCSSAGTMKGSVSGNKVNVTITGNRGDTISIGGTVSGNNSLSGSYTIQTSACGVNGETGTLSATLVSSVQSASWIGATESTQYPPGNTMFTADLTEDSSGNITGVLTFTGSSGSSAQCPSLSGHRACNRTTNGQPDVSLGQSG
jgi:hypothetical protein